MKIMASIGLIMVLMMLLVPAKANADAGLILDIVTETITEVMPFSTIYSLANGAPDFAKIYLILKLREIEIEEIATEIGY